MSLPPYVDSARLLLPIHVAGRALDFCVSKKLLKHLKKLGIDTCEVERDPQLVQYLEELAIAKPAPRTSLEMQKLAHGLQKLAKEFIGLHPELIKRYDPVLGAGRTWYGFFERLWLSLPLECQSELAHEARAYAESERLFTALPDREPCLHTLVWMDRQPPLWQVSWSQENAGGWVCVYTPVGDNPEHLAIVACRGTATRFFAARGFRSVTNDVLPELGAAAVQASWPSLHAHLQALGIRSVEVGGKSLGGGMAQNFTCLLSKAGFHVARLITFQSVGSCEAVRRAMQAIRENDHRPLEIVDYPYGHMKGRVSDRTPHAGGHHLGHTLVGMPGVKATQTYVSLDREVKPLKSLHPLLEGPALLAGFLSSHVLRLGVVPHQVYLRSRPFDPLDPKTPSKTLEKIRQAFYVFLLIFTLGCFARLNAKKPMGAFIDDITPPVNAEPQAAASAS